jgi:membrane protease YdiL (CAAX protease family)
LIKARKYAIIITIFIILTIPMFFGLYLEYFTMGEINWLLIIINIFGLFILLMLGKLVENFGYNQEIFEVMKKNDVINALIKGNIKEFIWFFFPIIIITEELIFRYYLIGALFLTLKLESIVVIWISSLCFSFYHVHIWFRYKNLRLLLIFLGYSFLLGFFLGYGFLKFGIIPCIIIHFALALYSYYNIYKRYSKSN